MKKYVATVEIEFKTAGDPLEALHRVMRRTTKLRSYHLYRSVEHYHIVEPPKAMCSQCRGIGKGIGPSHDGSKGCESGSIASGGNRTHCTCDVCF